MQKQQDPTPFKENNAYTKYKHYPPYCSTPEEMETRSVPPLSDATIASKLIHVTAVIRHGARTPWDGAPSYKCWDGYWQSEETGVWNCDLKTYMSPPSASKEKTKTDSSGIEIEEEPDFLFEKTYDALAYSGNRKGTTANLLNGTCLKGQLLLRGYDQELRNGLHLRQAYFFDGDDTLDIAAEDERMRLWDITKPSVAGGISSGFVIGDPNKLMYQEPNLRYRSDDEQRTAMSGQVLLRGLFEKEFLAVGDDETAIIRHHTADYVQDVLSVNDRICPRAHDLWLEAYESDEYKNWAESNSEVKVVKKFVKDELGLDEMPGATLDCLMTTICTDRTLPPALDNYDGSLGPTPYNAFVEDGDVNDMFERIKNVAVKNFTWAYRHNDAAYSKLGMGPLWKEIMTYIRPIVDSTVTSPDGPLPKLHLISGHDTTLMPLLSSLGPDVWDGTEWSHYASMIQIEVHEIKDNTAFPSGYAFRLIYNGEALTSKMVGCPKQSDMCDSQVLLRRVMPFAKFEERNCASSKTSASSETIMDEMKTAAEDMVNEPGGIFLMVLIAVVSMALGGIITFFFIRRPSRNNRPAYHKHTSSILGDLSMRVMEAEPDGAIISAVPAIYGSTNEHGDEKKLDDREEDAII